MKLKGLMSLVALMCSVAVGCGEDAQKKDGTGQGTSNSSNGVFSSSTESSTPLSDVTAEEAQTFCEESEAYLDSQVDPEDLRYWSCTISGVFSASFQDFPSTPEFQAACVQARDECLREEQDESTCDFEEVSPECTATIGDAEACATASVDQLSQRVGTIECEDVTLENAESVIEDASGEPPESCQTLEACEVQNNATNNANSLNNENSLNNANNVNSLNNTNSMGPRLNECLGERDLGIIAGEEVDPTDAAGRCARDNLTAEDPVAASQACIEIETGLSSGCSFCYAQIVGCSIDNCLAPCGEDSEGDACAQCQVENGCISEFSECSGLTGSE